VFGSTFLAPTPERGTPALKEKIFHVNEVALALSLVPGGT